MPMISGCCCFEKLENGSRASAVFTGITAVLNVVIDIWMLVKLHALDDYLEPNEKIIWLPPGILVFIYIELVFNLAVIGLSLLLWVGINYRYEGKSMVFSWVWGMFTTRGYHFFLMVYILVWIGGHRISDVVFVVPEAIVISIYWFLTIVILIAAMLCVVSYWQELLDELYGKEKRRRRFFKISNVRAAARMRSGTATPRSFYTSQRTLLSQSMGSVAQSSYGHPSVSSQYSQQPQGPAPQRGYGGPPQQGQRSQHPSLSSQQGYGGPPPQQGQRSQHPSLSSQPGYGGPPQHPQRSQHPSLSSQQGYRQHPPSVSSHHGIQEKPPLPPSPVVHPGHRPPPSPVGHPGHRPPPSPMGHPGHRPPPSPVGHPGQRRPPSPAGQRPVQRKY